MGDVTTLLLIDGNNLGYRAFSIAPLEYKGQRTEVIKIGLVMLRNYLELFSPDRVFVVWDGGHDPSRVAVYPEYKRRDKELTEAEKKEREIFFDQVNRLGECITKLGIAQVRIKKREADDVIFSLLNPALREEEQAFVVSTDADMFQLVAHYPEVVVYSPIKQILYTKEVIEETLGFPVASYLYYKALVGDPSDNLPGVFGVGPTKAKKLIEYLFGGAPETWLDKNAGLVHTLDAQIATYTKMIDLIEFRHVTPKEMAEGTTLGTSEDITTNAYEIAHQYGFDQILENVSRFLGPFVAFQNRKRVMEK